MPIEGRDAACVWDIVHTAQKAIQSVAGVTLAQYIQNEELCLTAERRLEIIGEAARRLSTAFRERNPDIPWRSLIALRNVMAHEYDEVDHERIWVVLTEKLSPIVEKLSAQLPPPPVVDK